MVRAGMALLQLKLQSIQKIDLSENIIEMVRICKGRKIATQLFIEKFEGTCTVKTVLITVVIMMFLPYFLFGWSLTESIYRAMILLVVASPCALVASIMPATLSAISKSAGMASYLKVVYTLKV